MKTDCLEKNKSKSGFMFKNILLIKLDANIIGEVIETIVEWDFTLKGSWACKKALEFWIIFELTVMNNLFEKIEF